ncbi:2'-5' RNA ligase family protein [Planomonospora sp. ID82291]|uniref:2'-5' RNA ligase family protein n=1 Tax=Planomonospora sp. ID82291 TaxID=2738136 RepID=UPI0018C3B016|nr:2'-5' RNA ligase family protein [Planomonospora sp. ID82291]MBG0814830.1 2'-5' RNA ligase family protein [Planomonospora sp. ID82291]
MRSHWWWRPGWRAGRELYAVHTTFGGQDGLHDLVRAWQEPLRGLPGLDVLPIEWLHLTMQGLGFTDEVEDVDAIAEAVRLRLAEVEPARLTFDRPVVDPESVQFRPLPAEGIDRARRAVRQGVREVRGEVDEDDGWTPHMSIAYSDADGPAEPYERALATVTAAPATITVRRIQLIVIRRDGHLYRWKVHTPLDLAG